MPKFFMLGIALFLLLAAAGYGLNTVLLHLLGILAYNRGYGTQLRKIL